MKPRDAAAVLFGLKFADDIHYKLKSSQASKATQNGHSRSFKVMHFGVSEKAIRD